MVEAAGAEGALDHCLLLREDATQSPLRTLELVYLSGEESQSTATILVAKKEGRYLVAVPAGVWHKKSAQRKLPGGALVRPIALEVGVCGETEEVPLEGAFCKVWLAWLSPDLVDSLSGDFEFSDIEDAFVVSGSEEACLPLPASLVQAAREKFDIPLPRPTDLPLDEGMEVEDRDARMNRLEDQFNMLQTSLDTLLNKVGDGLSFHSAQEEETSMIASPPGLRPAPKRKSALKDNVVPPAGAQPRVSFDESGLEGLDPMTVRASLQAGIPKEHLKKMALLVGAKPKRLEDYPRAPSTPQVVDPDSEVEAETLDDEENAGLDDDGSAGSVGKAIIRLTQIVGELSKNKKKSNSGSLEDVLNAVGSGSGSGDVPHVGGRRHAAAVLALRRALVESPELIYKSIERNMQEDFNLTTQAPNSGVPTVTARGWLEHRSRVQAFPRTVRWTWGVAGILDCLVNNKNSEARARAALMLAQADQEGIDRGGWLLAGEFSLEPAPPISSFSQHVVPDPMELQYSRLMDARWIEAFVGRLKEADDYLERRKKLSARQTPAPPLVHLPTPKPKGGGKGKGKKGANQEEREGAAE